MSLRRTKCAIMSCDGSYCLFLQDYHTNKINRDNPMCSEGTSLSVSLTTPLDYAPNAKKEGFGFTMEVYNWCKEPGNSDGNGNSITFDEAIKHLESRFDLDCHLVALILHA